MIIDCISDLHGFYPYLEGGDLLIIAGDLTARDTYDEYNKFFDWLVQQDYKKAIIVAGNHDNKLQQGHIPICSFNDYGLSEVEYLCDSETEFEGLKIWGIPWSKRFIGMNPHCMAFTFFDENWFYDEKVSQIPLDVDILITHSPPYSILDKVVDGYSVGSPSLFNWLKYVCRPRLHIFGHIHEAYGQCEVFPTYNDKMMISVNCSQVNERYQNVNKPVRIVI